MKKLFLYIIFGMVIYSSSFAQEKLIFVIDIIRHGDRTPLIESPGINKIWPQGLAQLTPSGMRQSYELGKALRNQYVNKYHLLPKHYNANTMLVRASESPRTIMSAQSILFGLYPLGTGPVLNGYTTALPEGFQPIPIVTVPNKQDSLLKPNHDQEKYKKLLETYIFNSPEWIQKNNELKPYYLAWSKIAGIPINNLFELIDFNDRLFIESLYHVPFPDGLSEREANMILDAGKWAFFYIENHPKLASIVGSELAETIKQEINLALEKRPLKYLLFIAHDDTIAAQLKMLGQKFNDIPYSSQLNYALFDMGAGNYEVRVTYNQKPLFIEYCGRSFCTLNDFNHLIASRLATEKTLKIKEEKDNVARVANN